MSRSPDAPAGGGGCILLPVGDAIAFYQVLGYFLTPAGLVLLGVLDASIAFMLPLGIDFAVVILAARRQGSWPSWSP